MGCLFQLITNLTNIFLEFIMSNNDTWDFYRDNSNEWRWRRTASNGRIVGASSQGYVNRSDCEDNARRNGWNG